MPCVELGDGGLLDESNSAAWLLSPESMLGGGEKAIQAEVLPLVLITQIIKFKPCSDFDAKGG